MQEINEVVKGLDDKRLECTCGEVCSFCKIYYDAITLIQEQAEVKEKDDHYISELKRTIEAKEECRLMEVERVKELTNRVEGLPSELDIEVMLEEMEYNSPKEIAKALTKRIGGEVK